MKRNYALFEKQSLGILNPLMHDVPKWSNTLLKILQQMLTILGHYALKD